MSGYSETVERRLEGIEHVNVGPSPGCSDCVPCDNPEDPSDDWWDLASEGSFSRSDCEACGSRLSGDRYPAHGFLDDEIVHLNVCVDCVFYLEYGDKPDGWEK